jgi:hypothetical protein
MPALSDSLAALAAGLKGTRGRAVVYSRAGQQISLTAIKGGEASEVLNALGMVERVEGQRWYIEPADLTYSGQLWTPTRGDRITETVGTTTYTHEVMAPADNVAEAELLGDRVLWRIHTKQVSAA